MVDRNKKIDSQSSSTHRKTEENLENQVINNKVSNVILSDKKDEYRSKFMKNMYERDLIYQVTNNTQLDTLLYNAEQNGKSVAAYFGMDCTAASLHIGHLIPLMAVRIFYECGHIPIILFGGATTRIGDPTGKDKMRQMLTPEAIESNKNAIRRIVKKFITLDRTSSIDLANESMDRTMAMVATISEPSDMTCDEFNKQLKDKSSATIEEHDKKKKAEDEVGEDKNKALDVDNLEWLGGKKYLAILRDTLSHISVNNMLRLSSVKDRLNREEHMSFMEMNYSVMQAYDFYHLHETLNCSIQICGADQWGNMVSGIDLINAKCKPLNFINQASWNYKDGDLLLDFIKLSHNYRETLKGAFSNENEFVQFEKELAEINANYPNKTLKYTDVDYLDCLKIESIRGQNLKEVFLNENKSAQYGKELAEINAKSSNMESIDHRELKLTDLEYDAILKEAGSDTDQLLKQVAKTHAKNANIESPDYKEFKCTGDDCSRCEQYNLDRLCLDPSYAWLLFTTQHIRVTYVFSESNSRRIEVGSDNEYAEQLGLCLKKHLTLSKGQYFCSMGEECDCYNAVDKSKYERFKEHYQTQYPSINHFYSINRIYALLRLKFENRDFVTLMIIKNGGIFLKYASEELKNDEGIVLKAVKKSGLHILAYASQEVRESIKEKYELANTAIQESINRQYMIVEQYKEWLEKIREKYRSVEKSNISKDDALQKHNKDEDRSPKELTLEEYIELQTQSKEVRDIAKICEDILVKYNDIIRETDIAPFMDYSQSIVGFPPERKEILYALCEAIGTKCAISIEKLLGETDTNSSPTAVIKSSLAWHLGHITSIVESEKKKQAQNSVNRNYNLKGSDSTKQGMNEVTYREKWMELIKIMRNNLEMIAVGLKEPNDPFSVKAIFEQAKEICDVCVDDPLNSQVATKFEQLARFSEALKKIHVSEGQAYGVSVPLLVNADGKKMGKTAGGAIWLDKNMLSPYEYYQYFRNIDDSLVCKWMRYFTDLKLDKIEELETINGKKREGFDLNELKKKLAFEATKICHGENAAESARLQTERLFYGESLEDMETYTLRHDEPTKLYIILKELGIAKSSSAARRLILARGVRINEKVQENGDHVIELSDEPFILSVGKKKHMLVSIKK